MKIFFKILFIVFCIFNFVIIFNVYPQTQKTKKINYNTIDSAYKKITSETGGQLFVLDKGMADSFKLIKPSLLSNSQSLLIIQNTLSTNKLVLFKIPVDSTISTLVVSVYMSSKGKINLLGPQKIAIKLDDNNVTITKSPNGTVFIINKPLIGDWELSIKGNVGDSFFVTAKGNSQIEFFEFKFVEYSKYRAGLKSFFQKQGPLFKNKEYTVIANLIGPYSTANFYLVSKTGKKLKVINLSKGHEDAAKNDFVGSFLLPSKRFRVVVKGKDKNGADFVRVNPALYPIEAIK